MEERINELEMEIKMEENPVEIPVEYYTKSDVDVNVTRDKLSVFIRLNNKKPEKVLTSSTVLEALEEKGVVYNIDRPAIEQYCASGRFMRDLFVAEGIAPIPEKNGQLQYLIEQNVEIKPKEIEGSGRVDYYDLGLIQEVIRGQELCVIIPPSGGVDGVDVFGNAIPFRKGAVPKLPKGANTYVTPGGMALLASCDGVVTVSNGIISISEVFTVKGDVDNGTGNIIFKGSVVVKGDVRAGFKIVAGGEVQINGIVEGAYIEAGGSIQIKSGVIGMNSCVMKSGGDIIGRYFENCTLDAGNNISAKYFVNCRVRAGNTIRADDKIVNGMYTAGKVVTSKNIGSEYSSNIVVMIDSPELSDCLRSINSDGNGNADLLNKIMEYKEELASVDRTFTAKKALGNFEKAEMMQFLKKKSYISEKIATCEMQIQQIKDNSVRVSDFKIVAKGIIYSGTKIHIGPYIDTVDVDTSFSKYYITHNGLECVQLNAADRD